MHVLDPWRDALGALSVILAVALAVAGFLIHFWQTLSGEVRPHPLSWFLFGVLSVTGYLVQRDQGAEAGSWALLAMSVICFLLVAVSVIRGERSFSRAEWTFLIAGVFVFAFYLFTKEPTVAAVLITLVDALGYGPTFTRGWTNPQKDSVSSFALNGAKFVPSRMAMEPTSLATCLYPATLLVLNAAVSIMLLIRRRAGPASGSAPGLTTGAEASKDWRPLRKAGVFLQNSLICGLMTSVWPLSQAWVACACLSLATMVTPRLSRPLKVSEFRV
jgi:hypothetical protein